MYCFQLSNKAKYVQVLIVLGSSEEMVTIVSERKQKPKLQSNAASNTYEQLIDKYQIQLACENCKDLEPDVDCLSCSKNTLMVRSINRSSDSPWVEIRPRPAAFKDGSGARICESLLVGEACLEKHRCPYPHSEEERELWSRLEVISRVTNNSLHVTYTPPVY